MAASIAPAPTRHGSLGAPASPASTGSPSTGRVFYQRQPHREGQDSSSGQDEAWNTPRRPPSSPLIPFPTVRPSGRHQDRIRADFSDSELEQPLPSARSTRRSKTPRGSRTRARSAKMVRSTNGDAETGSMYNERQADANRAADDLLDSRSVRSQRTATKAKNGRSRHDDDGSGDETEREDGSGRRRSPSGVLNQRGFLGSLLFPSSAPASPPISNGGRRSRRGSTSSAPGGRRMPRRPEDRSDDEEAGDLMGGLRYGDEQADDVKSLQMGGSRPPSALGGRPTHKSRTMSVASAATSIASPPIGDGPGPGYLYLHDAAEVGKRATLVNPSQVNLERERTAKKLGGKGHSKATSDVMSEASAPAVPRMPDHYAGGQHIKYSGKSEHLTTPEQAWYLLRTLVGMELQHEAGRSWRLTSLDIDDDVDFGGRRERRRRNRNRDTYDSEDRRSDDEDEDEEDEISEDEYEATLPAHEMPILRYLIKHFLLTLPIIRDTVAVSQTEGERPDSAYFMSNDDTDGLVPIYWSAGVLPILRSLHQRDLSQPVDMGRRGFGSIVGGVYGLKALERFVAGGLKLSTGSAKLATQEERRRSLMNPLRDIQLPAEPLSREASTRREYQYSRPKSAQRNSRDDKSRNRFSVAGIFGKRGAGGDKIETIGEEQTDENISSRQLKDASKDKNRVSMPVSEKAEVGVVSPATDVLDLGTDIPEEKPEESAAPEVKEAEVAKTGTIEVPGDDNGKVKADDAAATTSAAAEADPANTSYSSWLPSFLGGGAAAAAVAKGSESKDEGLGSSTPKAADVGTPKATDAVAEEIEQPAHDKDDHVPGAFGIAESSHGGTSVNPSPQTATSPGFEDQSLFTAEDGHDGSRSIEEDPFARPAPLLHADSDDTEQTAMPTTTHEPDENAAGYEVPETESSGNKEIPEPVVFNSASVADDVGSTPKTPDTPAEVYRQKLQESEKSSAAAAEERQRTKSDKKEPKSPEGKRKFHLSIPGRKPRTSSLAPASGSSSPGAPQKKKGFFAAMAVPSSVGPRSDAELAPHSMDLTVPLVPKSGHPWPWGAPVPFWKGTPVHKVAWGGFEVDVIGVRKTFTGHSFIIRVRRPSRLDEYVLRDESQFKKYLAVLDKDFPKAHVRRIPNGDIKPEEDAIDPQVFASLMQSHKQPSSRPKSSVSKRQTAGSDFMLSAREIEAAGKENDRPDLRTRNSKSRLASQLKEAAYDRNDDRRSNRNTMTEAPAKSRPVSMMSIGRKRSEQTAAAVARMPPHDAHRRALRAWLRDTLSVRLVGHHKETAAFLLLGSIVPKDLDLRDMRVREQVDAARRQSRIVVAQGAAERARGMYQFWADIEDEFVNGDGFLEVSEALRTTPTISRLPLRFQKGIEWLRMDLAQALHDLLVVGEHSGPLFAKVKSMHSNFPYFFLRQAMKLPSANMMGKALQDLLLNKRFHNKSLLQRILSVSLDDDPQLLGSQIHACRSRIQSLTMCEKLAKFVYASKETKALIRKHAADNNLELVVTIVRGADEPRLDKYDLERIIRASKTYRTFMKKRPSTHTKVTTDNTSVRLILDLQIYLRLLSKERDADQIRDLIAEDSTAEALEVLIAPFFEFLKRTYKIGNAAQAVVDLQKFMDQLIIIVDALRSRIQDPQKAVRILSRLLARHQQNLYSWLHLIHSQDTILEELFQWFWTCAVFLRRGLAETVDLDAVLPESEEDRAYLLDELDDLVEWHRNKRKRQYEHLSRRYAADVDGDDPVTVEGDGFGKSKVEALVEPEPRQPRTVEIRRCLEGFRSAIVNTFLV